MLGHRDGLVQGLGNEQHLAQAQVDKQEPAGSRLATARAGTLFGRRSGLDDLRPGPVQRLLEEGAATLGVVKIFPEGHSGIAPSAPLRETPLKRHSVTQPKFLTI